MSQQPDKLFKTKLENYHRPAPAGAWSRIESGLSKKNNSGLWLKIAASLLLVVVSSYGVIYILKKDNASHLLTEQTSVNEPTAQDDKNNLKKDAKQQDEAERRKINSPQQTTRKINKATQVIQDNTTIASSQEIPTQQTEAMDENEAIVEDELITDNAKTITPDNTVKSFKLIIEADQVNEKYLTKRTVPKATSEDDTSSGIKKLLDKANDLKNNQDPFGDLRQMKNEILALNFQSNKKHEQNK